MSKRGENIYKRKDGRWEGRYIKMYICNRAKYGYIYGKTYKEVKEGLAKKKAEIAISRINPQVQDELFQNIAGNWLETCKTNCKESTLIKYQNILEHYITPFLGDQYVSEIQTADVIHISQELLAHGGKKESGLSSKTVSDILSVLRRIKKYALSEQYPIKFEVDGIKLKKEQKPLRIFNLQEQITLIHFLSENMNLSNLGIFLCLYTGIRVGELCSLKWENISIEQKIIQIDKTMFRIQSNCGKTKTKIVITSPKSPCSIRAIPIQEVLVSYLKKYQNIPSAFLLTGKEQEYIEPRTMQYRFKSTLKQCGLKDANFHALRHTFATRCVEAGVDIKSLSEILGHSNVNITLNRYVHPTMDLKRENMDKLVEYLNVG